jgi:hypothetical protein
MNILAPFRPTPAKTLAEQRRQRALELARKTLPELPRDELTFGPFGVIDHQGDRYKLVRGLVDEPANSAAVAFYVNKAGDAVYLEPAGSRARIKAGG